MLDDLAPPRDQILEVMNRIYRYGMTTTSGGNVSMRDEAGVWITPARIDKGSLRREDIVRTRAAQSEGLHPPSSELPFHEAIYGVRPDVQAVVHAHPVALVAFSMCGLTPPTRIFHQAHQVCGEVACAPYALPGSKQLAENIAATAQNGFDSIILENHGVVTLGSSLLEAFQRFEALEFAARTVIQANTLGMPRLLNNDELEIARQRRIELGEFPCQRAQTQERELRRLICDFVQRGCRQRLLISTEGSFSARLGPDEFVITPSQRDRYSLTPDQVVLVKDGAAEAGKVPSRATLAHREIYLRHPDIHAILFAHPINTTAFSVTDGVLNSRTIPESYLVLRDIERLEVGAAYRNLEILADHLSLEQPAALLQNDGCVVVGKDPLDAFDRLEVLEATAEASIQARRIGEVRNMPSSVIDELRQAFLS